MDLKKTGIWKIVFGIDYLTYVVGLLAFIFAGMVSARFAGVLLISLALLPWIEIVFLSFLSVNDVGHAGFGLIVSPIILFALAIHIAPLANGKDALIPALIPGLLYVAAIKKYFVPDPNRDSLQRGGVILATLLLGLIYGYGALRLFDVIGDSSEISAYSTEVTWVRISSTSRATYYTLVVSPWGPRTELNELYVYHKLYRQIRIGQSVMVGVKQGRLHWPWIYSVAAPGESALSNDAASNVRSDDAHLFSLVLCFALIPVLQYGKQKNLPNR